MPGVNIHNILLEYEALKKRVDKHGESLRRLAETSSVDRRASQIVEFVKSKPNQAAELAEVKRATKMEKSKFYAAADRAQTLFPEIEVSKSSVSGQKIIRMRKESNDEPHISAEEAQNQLTIALRRIKADDYKTWVVRANAEDLMSKYGLCYGLEELVEMAKKLDD